MVGSFLTHRLSLHSIGENLAMRPCLAMKEEEKCGLSLGNQGPMRKEGKILEDSRCSERLHGSPKGT